jgi:hypothetical protein
MVLMHLNGALP